MSDIDNLTTLVAALMAVEREQGTLTSPYTEAEIDHLVSDAGKIYAKIKASEDL